MEKTNYLKRTVLIIGILTIIRLVLACFLGLDGGPAYYAMWSRHLELSYFDHPAMTALLIRLSTSIFGWNSFGIKLPGILLYLGSTIFMYKSIKLLGGTDKGAGFSAILFNFTPWIASGFGVKASSPDIPFLFFYMLGFYYFIKLYKTGNSNYWYIIGLITALGFVSKYKMIFIYVALFLSITFIPSLRKEWKKPQLYISAFIGLLGIVPTVIWNIQNDFASFQYHLVQRQGNIGFKPMQLSKFLLNQLAIMGIFIPIMLFYNAYKERKTTNGKLCIFFVAPAVILFSTVALFYGEPMQNWWASVYMILFVLYGLKKSITKNDKKVLYFEAFISIIGTIFYAYPFAIKLKETTNFLDHHLFDKAAQHLQTIIDSKKGNIYIGTPRYRTTAMLNVHIPNQKIYSMDYRKGDQFQIWYNPKELIGKNVIYVVGGSQAKQTPENLFNADKIVLFDKQTYTYNPWFKRTFYFYELKNYKGLK
ncbi:MAG: glycosyltransferase family 39 protein [bacterium]|nr:glycosyltransferase family 39 protein [bacterium]